VQTLACPFTGHCKHLPHKEAYMCMQLAATESNSETHRLNKAKIEWHYHSIDLWNEKEFIPFPLVTLLLLAVNVQLFFFLFCFHIPPNYWSHLCAFTSFPFSSCSLLEAQTNFCYFTVYVYTYLLYFGYHKFNVEKIKTHDFFFASSSMRRKNIPIGRFTDKIGAHRK
jgi:hypothetical protein